MSAAHTPLSRGQALVRLVDRLVAQKVWVDLVPGVPLAGVPLRPDRPQPELSHQPPDAPAANRNPLSQQRHLEPTAAVDWMVGENPVEPLQKLELLGSFRPRPVVEAAARNPSSAHCRLTHSPASGAIIARLSEIGRWRAARQENRTRPAAVRSSGADRRSPSAHPRPPAPCCRAQTARSLVSPAPASSC